MTTSYTFGTVSVTAGSTTVTGSGTGWLTANVAPGFLGLDSANGNPVPVEEIVSDTELRLVKPWRGTSASGQAYWLSYDTRDGQQTVNNAQRLAEYIALLRSAFFSAFQGLTPSANTFPYFGANAIAALGSITSAAREFLAGTGLIPDLQLPARLRITGSSSTNADTITENGWYVVAGTATGLPEAQPGIIEHSVISSQFMVQQYTRRGTNIIYQRTSSGGVWGAWVRVILGDSSGILLDAQLPLRIRASSLANEASTSAALDAVSENGWVRVPASVSPSGVAGVVTTVVHGPNNITQTHVNSLTRNQVFMRFRSGGTWGSWQLVGLPILGNVSQASGVPTGAIIERGSNANGEYVRFADGTQICTNEIPSDLATTLGTNFTYSASASATFPIAFAAAPVVTTGSVYVSGSVAWTGAVTVSTTSCSVRAFSYNNTSVARARYAAIGRWF